MFRIVINDHTRLRNLFHHKVCVTVRSIYGRCDIAPSMRNSRFVRIMISCLTVSIGLTSKSRFVRGCCCVIKQTTGSGEYCEKMPNDLKSRCGLVPCLSPIRYSHTMNTEQYVTICKMMFSVLCPLRATSTMSSHLVLTVSELYTQFPERWPRRHQLYEWCTHSVERSYNMHFLPMGTIPYFKLCIN